MAFEKAGARGVILQVDPSDHVTADWGRRLVLQAFEGRDRFSQVVLGGIGQFIYQSTERRAGGGRLRSMIARTSGPDRRNQTVRVAVSTKISDRKILARCLKMFLTTSRVRMISKVLRFFKGFCFWSEPLR